RATYCRTMGVEFMDIPDKAQREWLGRKIEPTLKPPQFSAGASRAPPSHLPLLSAEESGALLFQLVAAEEFEKFLHTRYIGQKRFSLEGAEALVPLLNTLIEDGAEFGVQEV